MNIKSNYKTKLAFEKSHFLAEQATQALLDEVRLSPKPGLVDSRSSGAHQDLSLSLMEKSAHSLTDVFYAMAFVGWRHPINSELMQKIGLIGRDGERIMLIATNGVNTHRGAIWSLGLLVTVLSSIDENTSVTEVAALAGCLAKLQDKVNTCHVSKGIKACKRYNVPGAREEAQQGFPHIINYALPTLQSSRLRGDTEQYAQVNALLSIMCSLSDTCILSRGGLTALKMVQEKSQAVLDAGGINHKSGKTIFEELEQQMLIKNISPGGSADLLAATLLLDKTTSSNY